jgi:hypothetical protein
MPALLHRRSFVSAGFAGYGFVHGLTAGAICGGALGLLLGCLLTFHIFGGLLGIILGTILGTGLGSIFGFINGTVLGVITQYWFFPVTSPPQYRKVMTGISIPLSFAVNVGLFLLVGNPIYRLDEYLFGFGGVAVLLAFPFSFIGAIWGSTVLAEWYLAATTSTNANQMQEGHKVS